MMNQDSRSCPLCDVDISSFPSDMIYCYPCSDVIQESFEKTTPKMESITNLPSSLMSMVLSDENETESRDRKTGDVMSSNQNNPFPSISKQDTNTLSRKSERKRRTNAAEKIQICCSVCKDSFTVPANESWKTMCLKCYRIRRCENCNADISSAPKYRNLCNTCYDAQLISKVCSRCSREFITNRENIRKRYCGKSDCVSLTPGQEKVVKEKLKKNGYSSKELLWLTYIANKEGIHIQHKGNDSQHTIFTKMGPRKVDGYCTANNTVYEFYGHYYHGHPTRQGRGIGGKSYRELYEKTMDREELIRNEGYTVVSIWEEDYDKLKL